MDYFSSRCGYVSRGGKDCEYWAFEGSPVNLCLEHLKAAAKWATANLDVMHEAEYMLGRICPKCDLKDVWTDPSPNTLECRSCGHRGSSGQFEVDTPMQRRRTYPEVVQRTIERYNSARKRITGCSDA